MNGADLQATIGKQAEIIRQQAERIAALEGELNAANERLEAANEEIAKLKELLDGKAKSKDAKKPEFKGDYSVAGHESEKKRKRKRKKKSPGRRPKSKKDPDVNEIVDVYWDNAKPADCVLRRQQYAWRLIDRKAVYVRYDIYDRPDSKELPLPPGLRNSRCEYGIEVIVALAILHYWVGVSIDKACWIIHYFTGLELSKSQADSLLNQLANDWSEDYEAIAELISLQMIVYIDETGWKVGKRSCYTWAFTCADYVLFLCGVGRGKDQPQSILGNTFGGIGVSDDYSVYKTLFSEHQLCWAHFLRKAIKLALQNPDDNRYAEFLDDLLEIYRRAVAYQKDKRLSVSRPDKVEELSQAISDLCSLAGRSADEAATESEAALIRLQNELTGNLDCLFVFVEHPEVDATNNVSERIVRPESEVRKGGRTSKTDNGARRRSVILTVFASLRTRMELTWDNVTTEIGQWLEQGYSIFRHELAQFHALHPRPSPVQ